MFLFPVYREYAWLYTGVAANVMRYCMWVESKQDVTFDLPLTLAWTRKMECKVTLVLLVCTLLQNVYSVSFEDTTGKEGYIGLVLLFFCCCFLLLFLYLWRAGFT